MFPAPRRQSFIGFDLASFIGREADLRELDRAVRDNRLVTLIGEVGVGKSWLAQRFARDRRPAYDPEGGVVFCDLRAARDVDGMAGAIARTLGIADEIPPGEDAVTAIGRALAVRGRTLVVLDNVEQLLPQAAPAVLRWLDLALEARMLVTSRVALGLFGEEVLPVGPLSLARRGRGESDAVRLFIDRVRAVRKEYTPSGEEPALIADLVRGVRGVPLLIVMCASRFGGDAGALVDVGAQRSGPSAVAWAFGKLGRDERHVLAQCSVFRGGFTLEAAAGVIEVATGVRGVARDASEAPEPVSKLVYGLLQRSLLEVVRVDGKNRFMLCQGMQRAAEELQAQDADGGAPWRHARYYLDLASGGASAKELRVERENLEAALEFGAAAGRRDIVLRAAIAIDAVSGGTGLSRPQLAQLDAALGAPGTLDPDVVSRALGVRAGALRAVGELVEAERDARTALALARQTKNRRQVVAMNHAVGNARFQLGDLPGAIEHTDAALTEARAIDDAPLEALCLQQMGGVLNAMGDHAASLQYFEAALATATAVGDEFAELRARMGLAAHHFEAGDFHAAGSEWSASLDLAERVGSQRNTRITHGYLGFLHFDLGNLELARGHLDECVRRSRAVGDVRIEGTFEGLRGAVLAELNRLPEAEAAFALAEELLRHNRYFSELVTLFAGHLDVARARLAASLDDRAACAALLATALRRIETAEGGDTPLTQRSDDARIAIRILRRAVQQVSPG